MIDLQDFIRNRNGLNLFDGQGYRPPSVVHAGKRYTVTGLSTVEVRDVSRETLQAHEFTPASGGVCPRCGISRQEWIDTPHHSWVCHAQSL